VLLEVTELTELVKAIFAGKGLFSGVFFEMIFYVTRFGKHLHTIIYQTLIVNIQIHCLWICLLEDPVPSGWNVLKTSRMLLHWYYWRVCN